MKKLILLVFLMMSTNLIFAELEVDIPFDPDIIGDSFAANGSYVYESEWITITNTGVDSLTYTFMYSYENLPAGWYLSVCDTVNCFMSDWPVPIGLAAGASKQIHISVTVESAGGFNFNFTFDEGDLTEPLIYDFTFNTADNVSANDEIVYANKLMQNYPNPFNPTTTISFSTTENTENTELSIYNIKGQKVKTLYSFPNRGLGTRSVVWNGTDDSGKPVSSGIYFYKLNSSKISIIKKMILLR